MFDYNWARMKEAIFSADIAFWSDTTSRPLNYAKFYILE